MRSIDFLEQLTELRKHFLTFTNSVKYIIKDIGEQPEEEIHRAKSGGVPGCRNLLLPWTWGVATSQHADEFMCLEALLTPYYQDFMAVSSLKHSRY